MQQFKRNQLDTDLEELRAKSVTLKLKAEPPGPAPIPPPRILPSSASATAVSRSAHTPTSDAFPDEASKQASNTFGVLPSRSAHCSQR